MDLKKAVLIQVKVWDKLEEERSLTLEESEAKKEAKELFKQWEILEECFGDKNLGVVAKGGR